MVDEQEIPDGILQIIGRIDYASIPKPPDYDEQLHMEASNAFQEWLVEHRQRSATENAEQVSEVTQ